MTLEEQEAYRVYLEWEQAVEREIGHLTGCSSYVVVPAAFDKDYVRCRKWLRARTGQPIERVARLIANRWWKRNRKETT